MANINVKVRINKFGGSLYAPNAKYDVIVYYASANSNRFSSALGIDSALAGDAAYFTRKSVCSSDKGVMYFDCKDGSYPKKFPDPRVNNSTVFYGGQFETKADVRRFMSMLELGCKNPDLNNSVKLSFEGDAEILRELDKAKSRLLNGVKT